MARGGGGGKGEGVGEGESKTSRLMGAAITFESIKSLCDTPLSMALLIQSVYVYFANTQRYQKRVLIHKSVLVKQASRSTQRKSTDLITSTHTHTSTYSMIMTYYFVSKYSILIDILVCGDVL